MPFQILGLWFRALLAPVVLGAAAWLLYDWFDHRWVVVDEVEASPRPPGEVDQGDRPPQHVQRRELWAWGWNRPSIDLVCGLLFLGYALGGRFVRLPRPSGAAADAVPPILDRPTDILRRPDGTELAVECIGPADAPVLVLTHGWGLNRTEWAYLRQELGGRFRVITWDLPGLGQSGRPTNSDWSLEKLAADLKAVVGLAGDRPVVLVGHSIGGMITLTFCRLFPELLGPRVRGLVLVHTTYTNPTRTTSMSAFYTAIQKPVLEPLCYLMIGLAPLVWMMNVLSWLNGSAQRSTEQNSFSGGESRGQLEFMTRFILQAPPAVLARGFLGMFRYDATDVLPTVPVPTLVVAGGRDPVCEPRASNTIAASVPGATEVSLAAGKHCGHFEFHAEFNQRVAAFAEDCVREPAAAGRLPA